VATSNTRDVKMQLSVETLGEENIGKLGAKVRDLAKQGGEAAPEFARLADEIDRLGEQAAALQSFTELSDQTTALAQVQERAAQASSELRTALNGLEAASTSARATQAGIRTELERGQAAYRETRDALDRLNQATQGAARKEAEYLAQKKKLGLVLIDQRAENDRLKQSLNEATAAVGTAEKAERALASAFKQSAAEADKTAKALQSHNAALEAAEQAALGLGVTTENVAAAQAEITQGLNAVGSAADALAQRVERLAKQERDLLEIRAFETLAEDARRMVTAAEYATLFEQALERTATAQRDAAQAAKESQWQKEAFAIVEAAEATQRLARATEVAAAAARELEGINAFEKQAEEAKRLRDAADYVSFWTRELQQAEDQARQTAEAATAASKRIADAFKTVGVRSAEELQEEIGRVRLAMAAIAGQAASTGSSLNGAFAAGENRIKSLELELRRLNGTLTSADRIAGLFKNSLGQITAGNIIADGVGYLVNKVKEMGVAAIAAIVQIDQLRRGLTAVYNSAATAATQILFLKRTANEAGVAFGSISQAFVKFSAATRSANIGLDTTNALFAAVTRTASTLGLSGDEVTGMLEALGQMASKGTVSLEELRQQLGDRLPGAISLTAKGLGLTEAALIKLVEGGGLAARDLFPALTRALQTMQGTTDGLVPTWERFKNALTETAQAGGDAGWTDVLTGGLKAIAVVLGALVVPLSIVTDAIFAMFRAVGILAAAARTLSNPFNALADNFRGVNDRAGTLINSFLSAAGATDTAATAAAAHTEKMKAAGVAAAQLAASTTTTSIAQQAQAFTTKVLADKTIDLGSKMVQIKAHIDELVATQQKDTDAKTKLVQAAKLEGDALVDIARLRGEEGVALAASVTAQERSLTALANLAVAHRTETELLQLKLDEVKRIAIEQDGNLEARKVEIESIEKKLVVSRAETEQSKQAESQARSELAVRKLSAETYKDNSARLGEYGRAILTTAERVRELERRQIEGKATEEELMTARRRAAEAMALYNDAVKDTINNLDRETRAKQAAIGVTQAKVSVEQQSLLQSAAYARSLGDVALATELEIAAKYRQIESVRLATAVKKLEIDATIAAIEVEKAALNVNDALYSQKLKEIQIRLEVAKAKAIENQASEGVIRGIMAEIEALRRQALERVNSSSSVDKDTASRNTNTAAINKQTAALEKQRLTADGFKTNADGSAAGTFTNALPVDKAFALANGQQMSVDEAAAAFKQAQDAFNDMQAFSRQSPGFASFEYQQSTTALYNKTRTAYEKLMAAPVGTRGAPGTVAGAPTRYDDMTRTPAAATPVSTPTKTININLGGKSATLSGSPTDLNNLEAMIRTLADGKATAAT
jgi:tape measure domain-containing protein